MNLLVPSEGVVGGNAHPDTVNPTENRIKCTSLNREPGKGDSPVALNPMVQIPERASAPKPVAPETTKGTRKGIKKEKNTTKSINMKTNKRKKSRKRTTLKSETVSNFDPIDVASLSQDDQALRKEIAELTWERGLASDLVDQILVTFHRGWITMKTLRFAKFKAERNMKFYEETSGRTGRNTLWASIRPFVNSIWLEHGDELKPCNPKRLEPEPKRPRMRKGERSESNNALLETGEESVESLLKFMEGFEIGEGEDLNTRVRRVMDFFQVNLDIAKPKAFMLRNAWNKLKRLQVQTAI